MSTVRLVVSDVDGTLVEPDKSLTPATIAAVADLREAGIAFAVTSGRPPRGMAMLVDPLEIATPIGGFNGGLLVDPEMRVLRERVIPGALVAPIVAALREHGLDTWVYQGTDWLVGHADAPHVAQEAATCQFDPVVRDVDEPPTERIAKVVGVSDDPERIAAAATAMHSSFPDAVSAATSQPYYLDVTHPDANKGNVIAYLSAALDVPIESIATIGDMATDVLMFAHSGMSIAMGNADKDVQRCARRVTRANTDDGFAHAMHAYVLG